MALVPWRSPLLPIVIVVALVTVTLAAQRRGGAPPAPAPNAAGAAPDSHVVQLTIYGGDIKWGAPVTDAEYLGKKK